MKKDNTTIIFWVLGLGGLGYALSKFFGGSSKNTTPADVKIPDTNPTTGQKYSAYEQSIMSLQTLLGVGVDAKIGNQTIGALKELYLGTLKYGNISPQNVEKYISEVKNHNTPFNLKQKADAQYSANVNSSKLYQNIQTAYDSNKSSVINFRTSTSNNGNYQVYSVVWDKAQKDWVQDSIFTISAGKRTRDGAVPFGYQPRFNAVIIRINYKGKYVYIAINPSFVQVI